MSLRGVLIFTVRKGEEYAQPDARPNQLTVVASTKYQIQRCHVQLTRLSVAYSHPVASFNLSLQTQIVDFLFSDGGVLRGLHLAYYRQTHH